MTNKIAFIGAAGSGKSTLASEVFVTLKKKNVNVEMISEWIRTDIHRNGPLQSIWEQYRTRTYQQEVEDSVPNNVDLVITDSGTLTPYFYSCLYAENTDPRQRLVMQDMYKYFLDDLYLKRYKHIFYLPTRYSYEINPNILNDGTRYQTKTEIGILEKHMGLMFTDLHNLDNIHTMDMPLDERFEKVMEIIEKDLTSS